MYLLRDQTARHRGRAALAEKPSLSGAAGLWQCGNAAQIGVVAGEMDPRCRDMLEEGGSSV